MGIDAFDPIPVATIDEMKQEATKTLIDAYGSVEEAERYAEMELTENLIGMNRIGENNLGDRIAYARGYLDILRELETAQPEDVGRINLSLTSYRTSGKRDFKETA